MTNQLIKDSAIVSISIGATRKFRIKPKLFKIYQDYDLKSGDVIVMGGNMQKEFKHEIVKVTGKKAALISKRINITFRQFK